jgi:hypothetical protein
VAYLLKARIVESQQPFASKQRLVDKNIRMAFSVQSVPMAAHAATYVLFCLSVDRKLTSTSTSVSGVYLGHPFPEGYKYGDLALQVGESRELGQ